MMKRSFGRLAATVTLILAGVLVSGCDSGLETRTFRLRNLEPEQAMELIRPYVYHERADASVSNNAITVRERAENLERVQAVLEEFDRGREPLRLRFHLIYANGDTVTDPEIAEITDALRGVLRFQGYRLAGTSVLQVHNARSYSQQRLGGLEGDTYDLNVSIQDIWGPPDSLVVHLGVQLHDPWNELLATEVSAPVGETVVIGTAQGYSSQGGRAVILAVTPELVSGG